MREYFDCSNTACYSGGVSLGEIVREMVAETSTEKSVSKRCQGYEGSPKGHRKYRDCMHSFTVNVILKYKEEKAWQASHGTFSTPYNTISSSCPLAGWQLCSQGFALCSNAYPPCYNICAGVFLRGTGNTSCVNMPEWCEIRNVDQRTSGNALAALNRQPV